MGSSSVTVKSDTVDGGRRTVVLQRALEGITADHYSFRVNASTVPILTAVGDGSQLGYHKARAGSILAFSAVGPGATTCICKGAGSMLPFGQGKGSIDGVDYSPGCYDAPYSDLLRQRNPSCDVRTYVGGMQCCRHGNILLDADQEVPPEEDVVYYKWRFYHRLWRPADIQVYPLVWYLSHARKSIEYDATEAPAKTPPSEAVHMITSNFSMADILTRSHISLPKGKNGVMLIQAGGHCHSPGCLSLELYNADTRELLCHIKPVFGTGSSAMDEAGYLWTPPCVWGSKEEGLLKPPVFHARSNFTAIKRVNNTVYHYGIMAIFQMSAALVSDSFVV